MVKGPSSKEIYMQADYISQKHFFISVHLLPDAKRLEVIKVARATMTAFYKTVDTVSARIVNGK